jgi:hypothetical protein
MRIVINNVHVNNVDSLTWCLGEAGLAGMNTIIDLTRHAVEVNDESVNAEELGRMLLALNSYGFIVVIE